MSQTWNGPDSSPKETGPEEATATKPPLFSAESTGIERQERSSSELLRALGQDVLGCGHRLGADDRLREAAVRAARLVAGRQVDRTAAAAVLSLAAQASGVGQVDALAVIRDAFHQEGAL